MAERIHILGDGFESHVQRILGEILGSAEVNLDSIVHDESARTVSFIANRRTANPSWFAVRFLSKNVKTMRCTVTIRDITEYHIDIAVQCRDLKSFIILFGPVVTDKSLTLSS